MNTDLPIHSSRIDGIPSQYVFFILHINGRLFQVSPLTIHWRLQSGDQATITMSSSTVPLKEVLDNQFNPLLVELYLNGKHLVARVFEHVLNFFD